MHVLIIEDDPHLADLFKFLVTDKGARVTLITQKFDSFYEEVDWTQVDAVIADRMLGVKIDGCDILQRLSEDHPSVVRILLTASTDVRLQDCHADHLLHKPTDSLVILDSLGLT